MGVFLMRFLVQYEKISGTIGQVTMVIQNPIDAEPTENSFYTEDLTYPVQESIPNMDAYLRVNLETKELYFDYIARETFETKVDELKQENADLTKRADTAEANTLTALDAVATVFEQLLDVQAQLAALQGGGETTA
jgi:hypothetical protein